MIVGLNIRFLICQEMFMPRAWKIACKDALYRLLPPSNERHGISFDMGFQLGDDRIRQDGAQPFVTLARHMNNLAEEIDIYLSKGACTP